MAEDKWSERLAGQILWAPCRPDKQSGWKGLVTERQMLVNFPCLVNGTWD